MQVRRVAVVVFALALFGTPAVAEVQLTINGGRVSLSAKNATASQILAEWARVGQTRIVNGERVVGAPLTLELTNVSEIEAIEIVLRSAGGYLLAPRSTETANASRFDRILILPASSGTRPTATAAVAQPPAPRQPQFNPPPTPDDNGEPNAPTTVPPNARPPVFNTFPQPQQRTTQPPPQNVPTSSPSMPVGVSVPGMVVPAPAPQGQPGSPGTPQ